MLILLEHLNFKVPYENGEKVIKEFFVNTLGCPECPSGRMQVCGKTGQLKEGVDKQMHVNLGLSQIHFEWCTGDGRIYETAQNLPGTATIAIDNMKKLESNLNSAKKAFTKDRDGNIFFKDPFGTNWKCELASEELRSSIKPYGNIRAGGYGNVLGIIQVHYDVAIGISESIANFYSKQFQARKKKIEDGYQVLTSFNQVISFHEKKSAPPPNEYDVNPLHAVHMCFYINDFEKVSKNMEQQFWANPDYIGPPINDNVKTVPAALERKQFRTKQIGNNWVLEHEIRDVNHPLSPLLQRSKL